MTTLSLWDFAQILAIVLLGAVGITLLLPHRHGRLKPIQAYVAGAALGVVAALLLARLWQPPADFLQKLFFYTFGLFAVIGGGLMITARNPVHSALWFAVVVLSTSGLFLMAGAQFLAAGTVIVYAGAIIVTFLFVIMLAQSEGHAVYDRLARRPALAASLSFAILGGVLYGVLVARDSEFYRPDVNMIERRLTSQQHYLENFNTPPNAEIARVMNRAVPETSALPVIDEQTGVAPHVSGLGGALFSDHLISFEIVGVILFVALIGAVAIATPRMPPRPGSATRPEGPEAQS